MLSAKSIEQELQRIESKIDAILHRVHQIEDRMNAERIQAAAEAYARTGFRFYPNWEGEAITQSGTRVRSSGSQARIDATTQTDSTQRAERQEDVISLPSQPLEPSIVPI